MNTVFLPLGALLRREVVTQLRRKRPLVLILIVVLLMLWTIAASWPSTVTIVWSQIPVISTALMSGIITYLLVGAGLFVPGAAAPSIVVEREQNSWDLLALTQLRPSAIVAGKVLAAVAVYLILVVALFPVFGSLFFLTGVDWAQGFVALSILFLTALTLSVFGVASSAWSRRTGPAVIWSYVGMLYVMGLPHVIVVGMLNAVSMVLFQKPVPYSELIMTLSSPIPVIFMAAAGRYASFASVWTTFAGHVAYQLVLIGIVFLFAVRGVTRRKVYAEPHAARRAPVSSGGPPPLPAARVPLRQRLRERRLARMRRRPPIPDRRNVMAVREIWWGGAGSARALRVAAVFMLGLTGILLLNEWKLNGDVSESIGAAIVIHGVVLVIFCAGTAAGLFPREIELRGLDMLRITLLTPRDVVRGKYIAGLRLAVLLSILSLVANLPLFFWGWMDGDSLLPFILAHGTVLVCAVLATSVSLAVSVVAKRTSTAVVGAFAATLAAFFGGPLLMLLTMRSFFFGMGQSVSRVADELWNFSSPVVGYVYLASQYNPDAGAPVWEFPVLWSVNAFEFLLFSAAAYWFTKAFYARYRAQDR